LVDQPIRTGQPGSETPHRGRRRLPQPAALLRLSGAVLVEIHDEWAVASERRYLSEASMKLITSAVHEPEEVANIAALTA
jgi:putative transposase